MMNLRIIVSFLLILVLQSCSTTNKLSKKKHENISIEIPETTELSNIILALTEYGKNDPSEVKKEYKYYKEMLSYFEPVYNHPLLDSVNYSREKWAEYLSFRTDAYAFSFNENGNIERNYIFYANENVASFDDNIELINDFVQKSKFREFYKQHKNYYDSLISSYKRNLYLEQMNDFLISEFGNKITNSKYGIILSPLVGRMNCHRDIEPINMSADFVPVPDFILSESKIKPYDRALEIHNLFTEMDHGYINPITNKHSELVSQSFDENIWNNKSGYENSDNAVFNEYLTWATYDIFTKKYFPNESENVNLFWHYMNDNRGFEYFHLFSNELIKIRKTSNKKIGELYPEILKWTKEIQSELTKPILISPKESLIVEFSKKTEFSFEFSEPMDNQKHFTVSIKNNGEIKTYTIDDKNNMKWIDDNKKVSFEIEMPSADEVYIILNWKKAKFPLKNKKGVLLESPSYFKVTNKK